MHYTIDYFRYVYGLKKTLMNQPDFLFLIGGADLEMSTIKQLLTANGFAEGQNLEDHHLAWGAKLSDYQNLFNNTQTFVGIELLKYIKVSEIRQLEIKYNIKTGITYNALNPSFLPNMVFSTKHFKYKDLPMPNF